MAPWRPSRSTPFKRRSCHSPDVTNGPLFGLISTMMRIRRGVDVLAAVGLATCALLLLGAGCEDRVVSPPNDGRNVSVTEGGDAVLATGDRIHFVHVDTDSRCPKGLECFWEGEASAAFSLGASAKVATPF